MDSKQIEWEYKMDAMECRVQQYEEERDQILLAASSSGVSVLPINFGKLLTHYAINF